MNIGDHLVSPRTGYTHHGLYIGNHQVIHYSGFANGRNSGQIATASLSEFSNGCEIRVRKHPSRKYDANESVERAFSRIGEDWYNVLMNNCEHFVNWCIDGSHKSEQVNQAIRAIGLTYVARQATAKAATTVTSTVAKSALNPTFAAGLSVLANTAAGTATTTALSSGTASMIVTAGLSTFAAPAIATAAVYGAVGYVAVSVFNWLWDD
jgi:hypothetical protein